MSELTWAAANKRNYADYSIAEPQPFSPLLNCQFGAGWGYRGITPKYRVGGHARTRRPDGPYHESHVEMRGGSCVDMPAPGAMLVYGVLMGQTANGQDGLRR